MKVLKVIRTPITKNSLFGTRVGGERETTFGTFISGNRVAIEKDYFNGKLESKVVIIWNDIMQKIIPYRKTEKGFERIG